MRIGFATTLDARNPRSWSGTPYFMARALAENTGGDIIYLGPVAPWQLLFMKGLHRLRRSLSLPGILPKQCAPVARANAKILDAHIRVEEPDVIVSPAGSALIGKLKTDIPIVYTSDTTLRLMLDYYPDFVGLTSRAIAQADELEAAAIERADILIYPTEWAARSARNDYGASPEKVFVHPFGPNLKKIPQKSDMMSRTQDSGRLELLLVGVNWQIKGGQIAVNTVDALRRKGISAHLTIVGCQPPQEVPRDNLTVIPFLNKNDPLQSEKLTELYLASDFFILPTRMECYGIVFCEAAAHGLPSIATATGGVPDVIKPGVTGYTLPYEANGEDYAALILNILGEPGRMDALRSSARKDFEERLNWNTWADNVSAILGKALPDTAIQENRARP